MVVRMSMFFSVLGSFNKFQHSVTAPDAGLWQLISKSAVIIAMS